MNAWETRSDVGSVTGSDVLTRRPTRLDYSVDALNGNERHQQLERDLTGTYIWGTDINAQECLDNIRY